MRFSKKVLPWQQQGSILKILLLYKFLYIFRKGHQIWLSYLFPSLSYGQNNLNGGAEHLPPPPPPPAG